MNNLKNGDVQTSVNNNGKKLSINGKLKDLLIFGGLAIALVVASWNIFYKNEENPEYVSSSIATQSEERVRCLLEEIEGVGKADVMVCETEEGVQSVVVVCEGAGDLQVVMHIRQAVAAALGTQEKSVKIYQKKE